MRQPPIADLHWSMWPDEVELVCLNELIPTQYPAYSPGGLARKRLGEPPRDGQAMLLVLELGGAQYLYDGHHRTALKLRAGQRYELAKVLRK